MVKDFNSGLAVCAELELGTFGYLVQRSKAVQFYSSCKRQKPIGKYVQLYDETFLLNDPFHLLIHHARSMHLPPLSLKKNAFFDADF